MFIRGLFVCLTTFGFEGVLCSQTTIPGGTVSRTNVFDVVVAIVDNINDVDNALPDHLFPIPVITSVDVVVIGGDDIDDLFEQEEDVIDLHFLGDLFPDLFPDEEEDEEEEDEEDEEDEDVIIINVDYNIQIYDLNDIT